MKLKLLYIFALIGIAIGAATFLNNKNTTAVEKVYMSYDYPSYKNFESLTERADTIIKGKIVDFKYTEINITQEVNSDDEKLNPGGKKDESTVPYTIYTVEVYKTFKGNINKKETIEVKEPGGIINNTEYLNEHSANLKKGKQYVFFLETYPEAPASLLNPIQASYEYDSNENIIPKEDNKIKIKMKDLNALNKSGEQ